MCKALPCNSQVEIGAALFKQIFLADLALIRTSLTYIIYINIQFIRACQLRQGGEPGEPGEPFSTEVRLDVGRCAM